MSQINWPSNFDVHVYMWDQKKQSDYVDQLEKWRQQEPVIKFSIAEILVSYIGQKKNGSEAEISNSSGQDLNTYSGKAVWSIEYLLNLELPTFKSNISQNDLEQYRQIVRVGIDQKKTEQILELRNIKVDNQLLAQRYFGRIKMNNGNSEKLLSEFLVQWLSLGKKISEFEQLTGLKGVRHNNNPFEHMLTLKDTCCYYELNFDSGYGGFAFLFELNNDVINSVFLLSID